MPRIPEEQLEQYRKEIGDIVKLPAEEWAVEMMRQNSQWNGREDWAV
jgi:hypothetical protein